jgi:hypothetical protein
MVVRKMSKRTRENHLPQLFGFLPPPKSSRVMNLCPAKLDMVGHGSAKLTTNSWNSLCCLVTAIACARHSLRCSSALRTANSAVLTASLLDARIEVGVGMGDLHVSVTPCICREDNSTEATHSPCNKEKRAPPQVFRRRSQCGKLVPSVRHSPFPVLETASHVSTQGKAKGQTQIREHVAVYLPSASSNTPSSLITAPLCD